MATKLYFQPKFVASRSRFAAPDFYPSRGITSRAIAACEALKALNDIDPMAIRYRDTLHMPDGEYPWTVCRVIADPATRTESYVCTNGERTRTFHEDDIFDVRGMHYRDGRPVHPHIYL